MSHERIDHQEECRYCHQSVDINQWERELLDRFEVPDPRACRRCRLQRRYTMRNERVLYSRKCDLTGAPIVSIFSTDSPHTVYSQDAWWSDKWDQFAHAREVNFEQPFFDQMKALQLQQPRLALLAKDSENSEYTNHSGHNRDCYLGFSVEYSEKVFYGYMSFYTSYLVDCSYMYDQSELGYQLFYCHRCYGSGFSSQCRGCTNVWFSFDLSGCESCFLCWNLRNKKYCFMNEQLTKEAYEAKVAEFKDMTYTQQQDLVTQWKNIMANTAIHQASRMVNCDNCSGNFLTNCHNVQNAYMVSDIENGVNIMQAVDLKEVMDCCNVAPAEFCYEMTGVINNRHCRFMNYSYDNNFCDYGDHVFNSENLFGCVGLNKQKFCILNKQYTEPEYKRLREKVIKYMRGTDEWGEFFPFEYSPFAYNETYANDLFPLTPAEAEQRGARWNVAIEDTAVPTNAIPADQLPQRISQVTDDILRETIVCATSGRPYKIQAEELEIYRRLGMPLPRQHPEVRFQDRMQQRPKPELYDRQCDRCQSNLRCTFAPDRPETIYCDTCYKQEVLA